MKNIALRAFSVFFHPVSFLSGTSEENGKRAWEEQCQDDFRIKKIPTDNHIRDILDPVSPDIVFPVYNDAFSLLNNNGHIDSFLGFNGDLLIAMDATWYFSSKAIHCETCSTMPHKDGSVASYHSMFNPVIVAAGRNEVIPLVPEFILPQDGDNKQDCENQAAKD